MSRITRAQTANALAPTEEPPSNATGAEGPKPITVRGRTLQQRSPLPARTNRNTHPGLIVKPKPKRTSEEVTTAAKSKAAIQQRVEELERQRVEVIAEMDLQEERDQKTYDRLVVSTLSDTWMDADRDDDIDEESMTQYTLDMHLQDQKVAYIPPSSDSEPDVLEEEEEEVQTQRQVTPPKPKQVRVQTSKYLMPRTITEVQLQRKKKVGRGETRASVDIARERLVAAGKKRKGGGEVETTRYTFNK